jgi:hypothetical protein
MKSSGRGVDGRREAVQYRGDGRRARNPREAHSEALGRIEQDPHPVGGLPDADGERQRRCLVHVDSGLPVLQRGRDAAAAQQPTGATRLYESWTASNGG